MTETKLAKILKHLVYDGVYASKEKCICGERSLDFKKHVKENDLIGR